MRDICFYSDYYPFGMLMPNRYTGNSKYRYSFNGMEKDNEINGEGNSYTTFFRQYDPRIGRWLSVDPKHDLAPGWSPYRAFFDNPLAWTDVKGDIEWPLEGTHLYYSHQHKKIKKRFKVRAMNSLGHKSQYYSHAYQETKSYPKLTSAQKSAKKKGKLIIVNSEFFRIRTVGTTPHIGIDYKAKVGTSVYSLSNGTVTAVEPLPKSGTGRYIVVEYESQVKVRFLHLSSIDVSVGDKVLEGQIIGKSGKSGGVPQHLHVDAVDGSGNMVDPSTLNLGTVTNKEFFGKYEGDYKKLAAAKRAQSFNLFPNLSNALRNMQAQNSNIRTVNVASDSYLNVRNTPESCDNVNFVMAPGASVKVNQVYGSWSHVTTGSGRTGWVSSQFLKD